nr:endogenous retrovirus group FC1 Env polyprotein-like [Aotus nancymaae]XP_012316955.1 endogenous retrovirus group FC1 Env polyprotein-like [Aotus nancymaae]XP_012316963.1 endogenous retrovirus group FC1 Env polyprotein-like [Aotus nancymaae]XP_012316967.1 endogenous retrovirus group FC1 Env polyprotein-like [Aotus nancymaae]XP_021524246.1 endogenous retrovirus group FC1 Env polyprotein-like [Aotus nancymaae]
MDPPHVGRLFLLALCLSNLPGLSSRTPYIWRFYLTENYTKTAFICNTPPYSHNHLLTTSDCPSTGCSAPIYLNFTRFNNIQYSAPLLCFHYDQQGACKTSSWRSCMGCSWGSCSTHPATKELAHPSRLKIIPDIDREGNTKIGSTRFSLIIPDPWNSRWTSPQKASVYETSTTSYPSSHLYVWRTYERTAHQVHTVISQQEQTLTAHLQPHSSPFSWLTFLKEGIALANLSGLTNLTSCLMCASLGQTPFVAVPYPFPLNTSASTSPFPPIKEVNLYTPPDFTQLPICYSLGQNYSNCNRTILVTTNLTAPQGTFFWCNNTLTKTLHKCQPSTLLCLPVTLVPRLTVYSPAEFQMLQIPYHRTRRAAFLPLAVGLSLESSALAAGLGGGALIHSHQALARLTSQFQAAIDNSAESLASLQRQITSVAQVALRNRRALDLLTAERGGTCIFLQEECCYYINESGLVETRIENLQKIKTNLQNQKFSAEATAWWSSSMYTLLSLLLGPLIVVCLILLIAPCFLQFLQRRFQELTRVTVHQMLLQPLNSDHQPE